MNCTTMSAVLAMVLVAPNPPPPDATPAPRSSAAIVGGKHIQPRATTSDSASAGQHVAPAQADEVEQLYQQLMGEAAPDTAQGKDSKSPQ